MKGFHFLDNEGLLRTGDKPPRIGEWLEVKGDIKICERGLHGSKLITQALRYAPGFELSYCEFYNIVDFHNDKFVAKRRRILKRTNIKNVLLSYAHEYLENTKAILKFKPFKVGFKDRIEKARRSTFSLSRKTRRDQFLVVAQHLLHLARDDSQNSIIRDMIRFIVSAIEIDIEIERDDIYDYQYDESARESAMERVHESILFKVDRIW